MFPKPLRVSRDADLIFTFPDVTPNDELEHNAVQLREYYSGRRRLPLIIRGDAKITQIERLRTRPYRPSMVVHGGRA